MTTTALRPDVHTDLPSRSPATVRLARSCARHPWRSLAGWIGFVVLCLAVGSTLGLHQATALDEGGGQSGRADRMLHDAGLSDPAAEGVLISRGTAADRQAAAAQISARMKALPEVAGVDPVLTSDTALLVRVSMAGDPTKADDHLAPLLAATAAVQRAHPSLLVEEAGDASIDKGINDNVAKDLGKAGVVSLPITLAIMLIAFGAIVAAGVPLLLALSSVGAATGLSMIASHLVPDSGTTSSVILMIGMAVGVDYSLFYCKRAREEEARGASRLDAIELAAQTSGHSVVVSGVAVVLSMAGLFLAGSVTFSSLAVGSILVVAVAVLGSLTVLPAMLALLGRRLDRPRVPVLWRLTQRSGEPRLWPWLLRPALRRPLRTLVVSSLALLAIAAPVLGLHLRSSSDASLPRSIPVIRTLDRLNAAFPSQESSHQVVVSAGASDATEVVAALRSLGGTDVRSSTDGRVHTASVDVAAESTSREAVQSLQALRDGQVQQALTGVPSARWAVTGQTAQTVDQDDHLSARLPWVIGFVFLLTFLVMGWAFRSVVLAGLTVAVNALSAAAAFGVLTAVFQSHWAQGPLGFHSTGTVTSWVPLFVFVVLSGLSMDYHVFVVSRVREAAQRGLPPVDAVRTGISSSAGVVTSAAFVMVSVFAVFASLSMVEMKEIGVGLGVAVLLDAVVVRAVLLPAALVLLGDHTWRRSAT